MIFGHGRIMEPKEKALKRILVAGQKDQLTYGSVAGQAVSYSIKTRSPDPAHIGQTFLAP
jgi:hypothetical protein